MEDELNSVENLEPLRATIDSTAVSAQQAADRSGQVLELMTSGSGEADPIAALSDMLMMMDNKLEAIALKLDAVLELLKSVPPSPAAAPTPPRPAEPV